MKPIAFFFFPMLVFALFHANGQPSEVLNLGGAGTANSANGVIELRRLNAPGPHDKLTLLHGSLEGSGSVQARVEAVDGLEAGVMIRGGLEPQSRSAGLWQSEAGVVEFRVRSGPGRAMRTVTSWHGAGLEGLRLRREGDWLLALVKSNGVWRAIGLEKVPMTSALAGVAIGGGNPHRSGVARFSALERMFGVSKS